MGLEIAAPGRGKEKEMRNGFRLKERLYKTKDGEVVRQGHPDAVEVYRGVGQQISMEEAVALGLVDGDAEATGGIEISAEFDVRAMDDEQLVATFLDTFAEVFERGEDRLEEAITEEQAERMAELYSKVGEEDSGEDGEVEVPDGVVPGETPGWPIVNGVVVDLPDEVREQLAAVDLTGEAAEPFEGYAAAGADDVIAKVAELGLAELVALRGAEEGGKNRKTVLAAIAARLELAEKALSAE